MFLDPFLSKWGYKEDMVYVGLSVSPKEGISMKLSNYLCYVMYLGISYFIILLNDFIL